MARAVRISRKVSPSAADDGPRRHVGVRFRGRGKRTARPATAAEVEAWTPNDKARRVSLWLFFLGFLAAPIGLVTFFVAALVSGPAGTDTTKEVSSLLLIGSAGLIVMVGYFLTLARTPFALAWTKDRELTVRFWGGRQRIFRCEDGASYWPLGPSVSLGSRGPRVEVVEVSFSPYRSRRWIVEEGLLNPYLPLASPRGSRPRGRRIQGEDLTREGLPARPRPESAAGPKSDSSAP